MLIVRGAAAADIAAITAIYRHHVVHGVASFETDPPDETEMTRRRDSVVSADLPYLVAELKGLVIGYAYAGPYRTRPAYRNSIENSVYVHADHYGQGAGKALMAELIVRCRAAGLRQMIAIIGDSANTASIRLHEAFGFRNVGTLTDVGFKHDRWLDSVIMQLDLCDV
jgi:L-amino acid N-acyltransferase YncA